MIHTLLDRVTNYVAANPGETLEQIARGIRARTSSVRDVLSSEAFSATPRDAYPSDRAQTYSIAPVTADGLGRRARRSQCDLIASVLLDGQPHTTTEIHQRCGFSRLNSRIAELRTRRGMIIECRHVEGAVAGPDAQRYIFHGYLEGFEPSEAAADTTSPAAVASDGSEHQQLLSPGGVDLLTGAGPSDSQLDLNEAA